MYNGFMKMGVSFMGLFFGIWMVASVVNIGPMAFLTAVVWFYAFFDCINKISQDDEEFYTQEDRYLFTKEQLERWNIGILQERHTLVGAVLIILGVYALWNNVVLHLLLGSGLLSSAVYEMILNAGAMVPQLVVAGLIIWAGVALIMGKKKEIESKEAAQKEPASCGPETKESASAAAEPVNEEPAAHEMLDAEPTTAKSGEGGEQ